MMSESMLIGILICVFIMALAPIWASPEFEVFINRLVKRFSKRDKQ